MIKRLYIIKDISINTGKTFEEVMSIYTKYNQEIYFSSFKAGETHLIYTPCLEEKVAELTEQECKK
jgi:hypothetical protein